MARCPGCNKDVQVHPLDVALDIERRQSEIEIDARTLDTSRFELICLVDNVRSLWNVGSIFRSADGAGFDAIFLCGITGTPPRKEIAKTSLGAEDHVPWFYSRSTVSVIPALKQQGIFVVGLEFVEGSSIDLRKAVQANKLTAPLCLCVGNEVNGLSAETINECDVICHLPMRGFKESLNVAVAFGIAAYEIADGLE